MKLTRLNRCQYYSCVVSHIEKLCNAFTGLIHNTFPAFDNEQRMAVQLYVMEFELFEQIT
jgi:hypothetical protein